MICLQIILNKGFYQIKNEIKVEDKQRDITSKRNFHLRINVTIVWQFPES